MADYAFRRFCTRLIYGRISKKNLQNSLEISAIANTFNNLLSELVGTFVLVAAVLYAAAPNFVTEDGVTPGLGALGALPVALIVLGIGICLGGTTGYAINPARDLGPRIIHTLLPITHKGDSNWSYAWIPIIGPILGAIIAGFLFTAL